MQTLLAQAMEQYRRRVFLEQVNEGYVCLNMDPAALAEWRQELRNWDPVLEDGLNGNESG